MYKPDVKYHPRWERIPSGVMNRIPDGMACYYTIQEQVGLPVLGAGKHFVKAGGFF